MQPTKPVITKDEVVELLDEEILDDEVDEDEVELFLPLKRNWSFPER